MLKYMQLTEEIVSLKTSIYKASIPVLNSKFRLIILKQLVNTLNYLSYFEGLWKHELARQINKYFNI